MALEGEDAVLADLGVTAQAAEQVEQDVLQQALVDPSALGASDGAGAGAAGGAPADLAAAGALSAQTNLVQQLRSVQQEMLTVQGALDSMQQGHLATGADADAQRKGGSKRRTSGSNSRAKGTKTKTQDRPSHTASGTSPPALVSASGLSGGDGGVARGEVDAASTAPKPGQELQQAVLQARLQALQGEQGRLKAMLAETQPGGGTAKPHAALDVAGTVASLQEDDLFGDDEDVGGKSNRHMKGPLVETERDRLIRTGMLTPFDMLQGFERKVMKSAVREAGGAGPSANGQAPWLSRRSINDLENQVGRSGRPLRDVIKQTVDHANAIKNSRPSAMLVDASELPRLGPEARQLPAIFWRQAASGKKLPTAAVTAAEDAAGSGTRKRRRHSTLPRQQRPGKRRSGGSAGRRQAGPGGGEEEQEGDEEELEEQGDGDGQGRQAGAESGGGAQRQRKRKGRRRSVSGSGDEGSDAGTSGSEYVPSGSAAEDEEGDYDVVPEGDDAPSTHSRGRRGRSSVSRGRQRRGRGRGAARDNGNDRDAAASGSDAEDAEGSSGDGGHGASEDEGAEFDDADEEYYGERLERSLDSGFLWQRSMTAAAGVEEGGEEEKEEEEEEGDVMFDGGFRVPRRVYKRLFPYQQTAVKWLWELYTQKAGGILGDEMGLGKTVQLIAFLSGLLHSGMYRPSLVVCPATVLRQWMREVRRWAPGFRVILLHDSARSPGGMPRPKKSELLRAATSSPTGLLMTTYESLRLHRSLLLPARWGLAILDEGHKIRNPDSEVTLVAKQLQTMHRIIMTGSPIQNRLSELWSLFDFTFPGKLGTLPVFQAQFAIPIQIGGYSNASQLQVTTAYKCAVVLRDIIAPYLLRRRKADVNTQLPKKTEQVLFCTLTAEQQDLYRSYLASEEVSDILAGARNALAGIDILRKVCNHPDLLERAKAEGAEDYGNPVRSGKLTVLQKLLGHWQRGGHKALVFCQTQQMLDIVEKLVRSQGFTYHRMDGSTAVMMRARLMDDFNNNPDIFVFLLTTKVGGLGVNLTGANRVLLYDPDWNPSNDMQARERAWRIGQRRDVAIYRLITSGTIEEKVYHRQIYKSFLTNKILQDPRQKRFFTSRDIRDLFTLGDEYCGGKPGGSRDRNGGRDINTSHAAGQHLTETARIFGSLGTGLELAPPSLPQSQAQELSPPPSPDAEREHVHGDAAGPRDGDGPSEELEEGEACEGPMGIEAPRPSGGSAGDPPAAEAAATGQRVSDSGTGPGSSTPHADAGPSTSRNTQAPAARVAGQGSVKVEVKAEQDDDFPDLGPWARRAGRAQAQEGGEGARGSEQQRRARGGAGAETGGQRRRSQTGDDETSPVEDKAAARVEGEEGDESHILRDLFDGAGIRAALDHQRIERANDPETLAMEREAARQAQRAAEALRQSRQACLDAPVNLPTWTGRSGAAGAPQQSSRARPAPSPAAPAARPVPAGGGRGTGAAGAPAARPRRFGNVMSMAARQRAGEAAGVTNELPSTTPSAAAPAPFTGALAGAAVGSAALSSAALLARMAARRNQLSAVSQDASSVAAAPAAQVATGPALPSASASPVEPGAVAVRTPGRGSGSGATPAMGGGGSGAPALGAAGGQDGDAGRIIQMLVSFLQSRGGEASSSDIVEHFQRRVPDAQMPLFRQLLKQVATLRRQSSGSAWVLRQDFQTQ